MLINVARYEVVSCDPGVPSPALDALELPEDGPRAGRSQNSCVPSVHSFHRRGRDFRVGTLEGFLDHPEVHSEARIVGLERLDTPIGAAVRLEVIRTITDRKAGVVRFDCKLLE